jgi:hypothetical protein
VRYLFLLFLVSLGYSSLAQAEKEERAYQIDTSCYIWIKKSRVNPYVTAELERTSLLDQNVSNVALSWGVLINDRISFGTFISVMTDEVYFPLIFPNGFDLEMVHGGIHAGYLWPVTDAFSAGVDGRLGFGEMEVGYAESGFDVFSTRFTSINPSLTLDYQVLRYAKLTAAFGYRFISGYDFNTDEFTDFNGSTFRIGLKIGLFKRLKWPGKEETSDEE